eukprot:scaffold2621_cov124-Isochrysis_galbana.AAC.7
MSRASPDRVRQSDGEREHASTRISSVLFASGLSLGRTMPSGRTESTCSGSPKPEASAAFMLLAEGRSAPGGGLFCFHPATHSGMMGRSCRLQRCHTSPPAQTGRSGTGLNLHACPLPNQPTNLFAQGCTAARCFLHRF